MGRDGMEQFEVKRRLSGCDICAQVTKLEEGITVLLVGGERSHVGALTIAEPEADSFGDAGKISVQTVDFPGHRERVLSEKWAASIAEQKRCRTIVQAGIHYDSATKGQIQEILRVADELLLEVQQRI